MIFALKHLSTGALTLSLLLIGSTSRAQTMPADQKSADANPAPSEPPASPLPTPAFTGPLQEQPPAVFEAGPFGKLAVNGVFSGTGLWQSNHVSGDEPTQAALSNGQIFIQKADTWFQFYLQAGAYTIPGLATPFLATDRTVSEFF